MYPGNVAERGMAWRAADGCTAGIAAHAGPDVREDLRLALRLAGANAAVETAPVQRASF